MVWSCSCSVDMSGVGAGTIRQDIQTTLGNYYQISFMAAGNFGEANTGTERSMQVIWEGEIFQVLVKKPATWWFNDIGYQLYTYTVRATATPSPLSFRSLENTGFGV